MLTVAPLYLALVAFLYVGLSARVIRRRYRHKAAYGDADDRELKQLIRAHGNCSEYAPLMIILLICAELQGMPAWVLHLAGSLILFSRVLHAWGLSQVPEPLKARQISMGLTFMVIVLLALGNLGHAIF